MLSIYFARHNSIELKSIFFFTGHDRKWAMVFISLE